MLGDAGWSQGTPALQPDLLRLGGGAAAVPRITIPLDR